jgi:hypothetical protein
MQTGKRTKHCSLAPMQGWSLVDHPSRVAAILEAAGSGLHVGERLDSISPLHRERQALRVHILEDEQGVNGPL